MRAVHGRVTQRDDHSGMAMSVDERVVTGGLPSPSSTSRLPRRPESDSRLGSAARCLSEMLRDPSSLGPGWRAHEFQRAVRHIRAELTPIRSRRALADSFAREATRSKAIETAYAIRWLELGARTRARSWSAILGDA
jgi:hypothetical protein